MKESFESFLIEAVKRQPILYDRNAVGYNNKEDVENAWSEVTEDVSKNVKNINATQCKLRWRTLRDRFVKQVAKTPDGVEHFTPKAKKWEYTNQLSFLKHHLKKRKCEEFVITSNVKREPAPSKRSSNNNSRPHSFSFVESKSMNISNDSSQSNFLSEIETVESEYEHEVEIPQPLKKRQKFEETEFSLDNCEIDEPILIPTDIANVRFNVNEESLNKLLSTTNELLQQQIKQNLRKSPNEAYFKVLDGYFSKLPPNELDKVKVEILNLILMKRRCLNMNRK